MLAEKVLAEKANADVISEGKHPLPIGLKGVIEGSFPIGGLSSSAAVIIVFMKAVANLNGVSLSDRELIELAKAAENLYVSVFHAASSTRAAKFFRRRITSFSLIAMMIHTNSSPRRP